MVNVLMAVGYCRLFIVTFRHPVGRTLRFFLTATAFATVHSVFFGYAQWWPWAIALSCKVRMLPPAEAVWLAGLAWRKKRLSRSLVGHVILQLAWLLWEKVITDAYVLMTTRAKYDAGRRAWVIGSLAIIAVYHSVFTSPKSAPPAEPEAAGVADRSPV